MHTDFGTHMQRWSAGPVAGTVENEDTLPCTSSVLAFTPDALAASAHMHNVVVRNVKYK